MHSSSLQSIYYSVSVCTVPHFSPYIILSVYAQFFTSVHILFCHCMHSSSLQSIYYSVSVCTVPHFSPYIILSVYAQFLTSVHILFCQCMHSSSLQSIYYSVSVCTVPYFSPYINLHLLANFVTCPTFHHLDICTHSLKNRSQRDSKNIFILIIWLYSCIKFTMWLSVLGMSPFQ